MLQLDVLDKTGIINKAVWCTYMLVQFFPDSRRKENPTELSALESVCLRTMYRPDICREYVWMWFQKTIKIMNHIVKVPV